MKRAPHYEADNHGNSSGSAADVLDRFQAEDDARREWLDAHLPKRHTQRNGGPCRFCGRPLSTKNTSGRCATCGERIRWHGDAQPRRRGTPFHVVKR